MFGRWPKLEAHNVTDHHGDSGSPEGVSHRCTNKQGGGKERQHPDPEDCNLEVSHGDCPFLKTSSPTEAAEGSMAAVNA
jgi:hypothetical protein